MTMIKVSEVLAPAFREFWRYRRAKEHLHYVLKGGRASGKSFSVGVGVVTDIIEYPVSALVLRKVQNTLVKSVFAQIKQATVTLGVSHLFKFVPSRLEITYKPRGNKIYFAGADDPDKLKSIKDADFPIGVMWIEELAEFKSDEEVSTIMNSVLREELTHKIKPDNPRKRAGKFDYTFYYTYNPPKRKQNWVNKKYETSFPAENTYIHHSTYLDNPHLSKAFINEAETTKVKNEKKYRWEYLGEAIGTGVVPFDNLYIKKGCITDDMVRSFDNIRQGVDFGYGPDPLAFVRWHYDKRRGKIYALDELYDHKVSNRELAKWIRLKEYESQEITADNAEPKSIAELKMEHGIRRIVGAKKGPDSVEYGEEWLGDLVEIVIDPLRTPHTAREFENIDYQTDKDGNPKPRLEDKENHTIDATRYAFERDMKQSGVRVLT
ncbi:PBSX family phage terminase large subunit [Bacillus altitudinis]|uniref:PBSX family phage terminase large subunit n=1 Tax=Bacillus altitudinis TaxID=293387 RepID=UPI0024818B7E|nr:PBSX family phage terminase large subunit [Bacillus altitudinis]